MIAALCTLWQFQSECPDAVARAQNREVAPEPADWVFDYWQPYESFDAVDFYPHADVPWESVARGELHFQLYLGGGFEATEIECVLSYGGKDYPAGASSLEECQHEPGCFDLRLAIGGIVRIEAPTSGWDFYLSLSCYDVPGSCGFDLCNYQGWGFLEGTLYLYADDSPAAHTSWSLIKSRY